MMYKVVMKSISLIIFCLLFIVNLKAENNSSIETKFKMLDVIEEQSKQQKYVLLKSKPIVYFRDFIKFPDEKKWKFAGSYVYIEGKITNVHYTDYGGTRAVIEGYGCGFYNRYHDNLKQQEAQKKRVHAICELPKFSSCIPVLEGVDNYYN
ncbi:MAG: hypothetical protein ACOC08_05090 [Campylobacterales bacterium]